MKYTKTFSVLVLSALVIGMGLVAVGGGIGSEFIKALGTFPLLLAMFLLPHAFLEWEAPRADGSGNPPL